MEETKKKEKRIGTYTFGIMLILVGISTFIMTFTKWELIEYLLMFWPLLLIFLGMEILYFNSKSDVKVKIDLGSIFLMCIVLFFVGVFSLGNYFVNKVFYDNDVKTFVVNEYMNDATYGLYMDKEISIFTDQVEKLNVSYIQDENCKESCHVRIRYQYQIDDDTKLVEILNNHHTLYHDVTDNDTLTITHLPPYIKQVDIQIYANRMQQINYTGKIHDLSSNYWKSNNLEIF